MGDGNRLDVRAGAGRGAGGHWPGGAPSVPTPPTVMAPPRQRLPLAQRQLLQARSPLYEALATLGLLAVGIVGMVMLETQTRGLPASADRPVVPTIVAVYGFGLAAVAAMAWVRRIGLNAGAYGWGLVLLALVPWETAVFRFSGEVTSIEGIKAVVVMAMGVTVISALVVRRPLITKMWNAGGLGAPLIAELGWILSFAATEVFLGMILRMLNGAVVTESYGYREVTLPDPHPGMAVLAVLLALAAALIGFVTLIAATIGQHAAIRRAKVAQQAQLQPALAYY